MTKTRFNKKRGESFSEGEVLNLYAGIYDLHFIKGYTMSKTSRELGVSINTVKKHMPGFREWVKQSMPEEFDPEYMTRRFMHRMNMSRGLIMSDVDKHSNRMERARMLDIAARHEDRVMNLLQDIGVVEREADSQMLEGRLVFSWGESEEEDH